MIKYLSTIVLTVALCCACDGEDFSADPTLMPPATQTGANTFGCLIRRLGIYRTTLWTGP